MVKTQTIKALALIVALLTVPLATLWAVDEVPSQGLEISPPLVELLADPGQAIDFEIKLRNITDSGLTVKTEINDFTAKDEEGTPQLLTAEQDSSYSLRRYIKPSAGFTLAGKAERILKINIDVPANASPGGHYAVVRFTGLPPELAGQENVALSASVGTLVLLNVSGDIKSGLQFEELYVEKADRKGSVFENLPLNFVERLKNTGNIHLKPSGDLVVKNVFGQEVTKLAINEDSRNVLPDSIRRFEQELAGRFMIGRYTATATLHFDSQTITSQVAFWVLPYKPIGAVLGVLLLLATAIRLTLKRYKKRVIARVQTPPDRPNQIQPPRGPEPQ